MFFGLFLSKINLYEKSRYFTAIAIDISIFTKL